MVLANTTLQITGIDFDNIKTSLKSYLRTKQTLKDVDFEGSNIAILIDLLAQNTYYGAMYTNLIGSEMFLDSAQLRNSVVSRAKELCYVPHSANGSKAYLNLTITPTDVPDTITIPKRTRFSTTIDNNTYMFSTTKTTVVAPIDGAYVAENVEIVEGVPLTHKYTVNTNETQYYLLPNANSDIDQLTVRVQVSATNTANSVYSLATDLTEITAESKVYFIEEYDNSTYRVYFGDGILGKSVEDGNIVILEYTVCNGSSVDKASTFALMDTIDGYSNVAITTVSASTGGQDQESISSVKRYAPGMYETQNRAVTAQDYERIILSENTDFSACSVWGGEENVPPVYGKVFIAVKPTLGTYISDARKVELVASLKKRNVLSIDPQIVDPEFIYVIPSVEVTYDPTKTVLAEGTIKANVISAITAFNTTNLNDFGAKFRYSKFIKAIDDVSSAILSNETTIKIQKRFAPTPFLNSSYTIEFRNPLANNGNVGDITSTTFTYGGFTCFFQDNGTGGIDIVRTITGSEYAIVLANAGTVNYTTGTIYFNTFSPAAVDNDGVIKISAIPASVDVVPLRDQLLIIDDVSVTMVQETP